MPNKLAPKAGRAPELESELEAIGDGESEAVTGKRDLQVDGEEKGEKE